jgi:hypothetical protein
MLNTILTARKPVYKTKRLSNTHAKNINRGARIWGILTHDDREAGFELILSDDDQLYLLRNNAVLSKFDPLDYTLQELSANLQTLTQQIRSCVFQELLNNTTTPPLPSWFDKPLFPHRF